MIECGQHRLQINKCLLLDKYAICSAHGEAQSSGSGIRGDGWPATEA